MTREELAVTNRTYKMYIGERMVEVVKDGSGWRASNGTIFADSWQSVWCPNTEKLLLVLEQTSKWKDWHKQIPLPDGCELLNADGRS